MMNLFSTNLIIAFVLAIAPTNPFNIVPNVVNNLTPTHQKQSKLYSSTASTSSFSVKSSTLDTDLTAEERSVVDVFRIAGPSVAFVTSTLNPNRAIGDSMSLGAGSGFLIAEDGYLVTNYHVIERAYVANKRFEAIQNRTQKLPFVSIRMKNASSPAEVKVRINSSTKFLPARIVDVRPELDLAILKVDMNGTTTSNPITMGSSTSLLVGQKVIAIGNPFGLDQTVTAGVVSALNRNVATRRNTISNCVQTDAAINPGNSGGPLLNTKGQWIGVNTAIISTTGSNAGIGFAIPSDKMKRDIRDILEKDRGGPIRGYLGCSIMNDRQKQKIFSSIKSLHQIDGALITSIKEKSPASIADVDAFDGTKGDLIVAVNGTPILNAQQLESDLEVRKENEQLAFTLYSLGTGEKRVVYVTLGKRS